MKKYSLILIVISFLMPLTLWAESVPVVVEGSSQVTWPGGKDYEKWGSSYNYCYNYTSSSFSFYFNPQEVKNWKKQSSYKTLIEKPLFKGKTPVLKAAIFGACPGGGSSATGSVYVYRNSTLLGSATAYDLGGIGRDGGVFVQNIKTDGENLYGDVWTYHRTSLTSYPANLIGKNLLLNELLISGYSWSPAEGYGCTRCYFYYSFEDGIKGEITATKDKKSVRAVRPGEKVDIHWSATKE
jgi:hypothetical protein